MQDLKLKIKGILVSILIYKRLEVILKKKKLKMLIFVLNLRCLGFYFFIDIIILEDYFRKKLKLIFFEGWLNVYVFIVFYQDRIWVFRINKELRFLNIKIEFCKRIYRKWDILR